ncbi:MAG: hypothetical protein ACOCZ5_03220 [bacterium]
MSILYDGKRNQKVVYSKFNKEFNYIAEDNNVNDFEDVVVFGDKENPDGTNLRVEKNASFWQSTGNKLQGTIAGFRGRREPGRTKRGNNVQTTQKRRKFINVDLN